MSPAVREQTVLGQNTTATLMAAVRRGMEIIKHAKPAHICLQFIFPGANQSDSVSPDIVCEFFQPLSAWEG